MDDSRTADDYLNLTDADLVRQCKVDTFRVSGPGGQHRNKRDTAVRLRHGPTGLSAQAFERRSQRENRVRALRRLRERIALEARRPLDLSTYSPPPEVMALLPSDGRPAIGPRGSAYWPAVRELLDLFVALDCSVSETAQRLDVNTGRLSKVLTSQPHLLRTVNALRAARAQRPLR